MRRKADYKNDKENPDLWDSVYHYLEQTYDLEHVKKIDLNADGGSWIKAGMRRIHGITYVLEKLRETIRTRTKGDFKELVRQAAEMEESHADRGSRSIYPVQLDGGKGTAAP